MALIEWQESFALGIEEIDAEHRSLIQLINAAYSAIRDAADPVAIEEFLGEIHARIAAHFALEERAMLRARHPEYTSHKADHERLLDEIMDMVDAAHEGSGFDRREFSEMLAAWFSGHFRSFDARLHTTLRY